MKTTRELVIGDTCIYKGYRTGVITAKYDNMNDVIEFEGEMVDIDFLEYYPTNTLPIKETVANEPLEILVAELRKSGLRKYTCINDSGYSGIEREIVRKLTDWQKQQDEALRVLNSELLDFSNKVMASLSTYGQHPLFENWYKNITTKAKNIQQ